MRSEHLQAAQQGSCWTHPGRLLPPLLRSPCALLPPAPVFVNLLLHCTQSASACLANVMASSGHGVFST